MKKRLSLEEKADLAMKAAVRKVVARHKKSGRSLAILENGKVKRVKVK